MKKILLFLGLIMCFPFIVHAQDKCVVISGSGSNPGDEIACGSEHFYVIENDGENVKMLAKYNLNAGISIYKEKIEKEADDPRTDEEYCYDLAYEKGGYLKYDEFYNAPGYCFYAVYIDDEKILQNENALSAHWDEEGNYLYPQVGDNYMEDYDYLELDFSEGDIYNDTGFFDFKVPLDGNTNLSYVLSEYFNELNDMGFKINDIGLLSVNDINNITKKVTNKSLPLKEWATAVENIPTEDYYDYISTVSFGDLKPYLTKDYSWLYSTSYWNSTIFDSNKSYYGLYYVFVSGQGKLCGAGFEYCAPETAIGCGIRPVVSIATEDLTYLIRVETNNYGKIDVVNESKANEKIKFKITTQEGYELKTLEIITATGEKISFDSIETSEDTILVSTKEFLMPHSNVLIKATWEKIPTPIINPETGESILIALLILTISFCLIIIFYKNKKRFE